MTFEIRGPYLRPEPKPLDDRRPDARPMCAFILAILGVLFVVTSDPIHPGWPLAVGALFVAASIGVVIHICERPHQ